MKINFNLSKEKCTSLFNTLDIIGEHPFRQYHAVLALSHDLRYKSRIGRVYVWHPYDREVVIESDLDTPHCVSYIDIGFNKNYNNYYPIP